MGTIAPAALAQPTVDGQILASVSGGVLSITVQLRTNTGADDLGTTTLRIGFNDAALSPVSDSTLNTFLADGVDYTFVNFDNNTDADYGNARVSYPLAGRVHVNIELNNDNAGTLVAAAPAWTDVVTIRFAINDTSQTSRNAFFAGNQEVYDGDNARLWTPGVYTGADIKLPVELASFGATSDGAGVVLRWATASETNNAGFAVEHRAGGGWHEVAFVSGAGTTSAPQAYERRIEGLEPGAHTFRLRQVDLDGSARYSSEVEARVAMTEPVRFKRTGPNPVVGRTTFELAVREPQHVAVDVFDALGRRVARLHDGLLEAGRNVPIMFDAAGQSAGLYVVVVRGERVRTTHAVTVSR